MYGRPELSAQGIKPPDQLVPKAEMRKLGMFVELLVVAATKHEPLNMIAFRSQE